MATTHMNEDQAAAVNKIVETFTVSDDRLIKIADQFVREMEKGLDHQGATSKYKQINNKKDTPG